MFPRSPITSIVVMKDLVAGYSSEIIEIYIFNYIVGLELVKMKAVDEFTLPAEFLMADEEAETYISKD